MGYYTNHSLEIISGGDNKTDYRSEIEDLTIYGGIAFKEEVKWYNHEDQMRKYSLRHPETVFALKGEGEESGDIWVEYYKNGKMQREEVIITFGEYNENKLK